MLSFEKHEHRSFIGDTQLMFNYDIISSIIFFVIIITIIITAIINNFDVRLHRSNHENQQIEIC